MNIDTLLLVDDEKMILRALERVFSDGDLRVLTAMSGDEALALLAENSISVVVSDNRMPGMMGTELLTRIKEISPDTGRIMLTGTADVATAMEAINEGSVFKFLVKPWDIKVLKSAVTKARARFNLVKALRRSDEATFLGIAKTIELKDPATRGHCDRVAGYALLIAEGLHLSKDRKLLIKHGGWLHDCGKIGVPDAILNKNNRLCDIELGILRKHPGWGAEVAKEALLHQTILNIIQFHHEQYDGNGYPSGLQGEKIPLEARIVAVANVFDALTSHRGYRKACLLDCPMDRVFATLGEMQAKELDPELVNILMAKIVATELPAWHGMGMRKVNE